MGQTDMTVEAAARFLGIRAAVLREHIERGEIDMKDGIIPGKSIDKVYGQKKAYISLKDFLMKYENLRFKPVTATCRLKYIDFLEENRFFGIEIVEPEKILYSVPNRDEFFFSRMDVSFLEYKSRGFFDNYGLTEEEKIEQILGKMKSDPKKAGYVRKYIRFLDDGENIYTPSLTGFVRIISEMPKVEAITDDDVVSAMECADTARSREHLVRFFTLVSQDVAVCYGDIKIKNKESEGDPAYTYEEFVKLAKILFNDAYDKAHGLTVKALGNSIYAEQWMFLACHYVCGWRSSDICSRWVYPNITDDSNPFDIRIRSLAEDIQNNKIPETVYEDVCLYVIRRIEMTYNIPQKTGKGRLRSAIVPELRRFFGKLTLIAECHHFSSGEGYMKAYRAPRYRNWVTCRDFFGEECFGITGMNSISSRRLNKSYLQGIELAARCNGSTALVAHVVAAYARSHADIDTTAKYLRDHGLTGESADVVLFMMMQRGVFGVALYQVLIAAFPESFGRLTSEEQSCLMQKIPLSAYELELSGSVYMASERIAEELSMGKAEVPIVILKAMMSVAQGNGGSKDQGVFCIRKALGFSCDRPHFESCIANLCPNHIFTREGIPALLKVIRDYTWKGRASGNKKYIVALRRYIIPAFQDVLNGIIREQGENERTAIKRMIEEALNE